MNLICVCVQFGSVGPMAITLCQSLGQNIGMLRNKERPAAGKTNTHFFFFFFFTFPSCNISYFSKKHIQVMTDRIIHVIVLLYRRTVSTHLQLRCEEAGLCYCSYHWESRCTNSSLKWWNHSGALKYLLLSIMTCPERSNVCVCPGDCRCPDPWLGCIMEDTGYEFLNNKLMSEECSERSWVGVCIGLSLGKGDNV